MIFQFLALGIITLLALLAIVLLAARDFWQDRLEDEQRAQASKAMRERTGLETKPPLAPPLEEKDYSPLPFQDEIYIANEAETQAMDVWVNALSNDAWEYLASQDDLL